MFLCFIFVLSFLVPVLMHYSRLLSNNKDLLTYLHVYSLKSSNRGEDTERNAKVTLA